MKRDLLLEIGVEEMPAGFMSPCLAEIKELARKGFAGRRIAAEHIASYGTPRRIVLYMQGVDEMQQEAVTVKRGPKKAAAFDADGQPTKAAQGFARGQGIAVEELTVREEDGIAYMVAVKQEAAAPTAELLPALLSDIIGALSFPKSMRWGAYQTRFARPVRWLLALFGEDEIPLAVENIASGRITYGHRFLAPQGREVRDIPQYFEILRAGFVVLDPAERKAMIWEQVRACAEARGYRALENEDLLEEVNYLLEYPTAFFGEFSADYLAAPPEVLSTSMIEHQRYFPVYDDSGDLQAGFIGVRNGGTEALDIVRAGNQRVLKARLEDALFFWKEDCKKDMNELVESLKTVTYHEKLGSNYERVQRVQRLAVLAGQMLGLSDAETLARAAWLCKADLQSSMVYEFPELQGIMGRYYAREQGEAEAVSEAILEHYMPRFAGDTLPATAAGRVLAISEKADHMTGCFAIGIRPTGSQDPYAMRRNALGLVSIILDAGLDFELSSLLAAAYQGFDRAALQQSEAECGAELADFIKLRMRGMMIEQELPYDLVDAVLSLDSTNLTDLRRRMAVIHAFREEGPWEDFMVVYNRSQRLSKDWEPTAVDAALLEDATETALWQGVSALAQDYAVLLAERRYAEILSRMAALRPLVDAFFDAVMVMAEEEKLKANRLSMLKTIAGLANGMADFTKLVR